MNLFQQRYGFMGLLKFFRTARFDEFENNIIEHIANRVNRTIKTVTEVTKESYRTASYYLNEDGQWVCFEEDHMDKKWACWITSHLTKSEETIKSYHLGE